jgi:hypothetical protein
MYSSTSDPVAEVETPTSPPKSYPKPLKPTRKNRNSHISWVAENIETEGNKSPFCLKLPKI